VAGARGGSSDRPFSTARLDRGEAGDERAQSVRSSSRATFTSASSTYRPAVRAAAELAPGLGEICKAASTASIANGRRPPEGGACRGVAARGGDVAADGKDHQVARKLDQAEQQSAGWTPRGRRLD